MAELDLAYATARAVEDVMCGVVSVTVGTGYPLVESGAVRFPALTFVDADGQTLTIALTAAQASKIVSGLGEAEWPS